MAEKLSQIAGELLEAQAKRRTVTLMEKEFAFFPSNYGLKRLVEMGRDPIGVFTRLREQAPDVIRFDGKPLADHTKDDLKKIAHRYGVDTGSLTKAELVEAIEEAYQPEIEMDTEAYLDVQSWGYAGLVTFDPELDFDTFLRLTSMADTSELQTAVFATINEVNPEEVSEAAEGKNGQARQVESR